MPVTSYNKEGISYDQLLRQLQEQQKTFFEKQLASQAQQFTKQLDTIKDSLAVIGRELVLSQSGVNTLGAINESRHESAHLLEYYLEGNVLAFEPHEDDHGASFRNSRAHLAVLNLHTDTLLVGVTLEGLEARNGKMQKLISELEVVLAENDQAETDRQMDSLESRLLVDISEGDAGDEAKKDVTEVHKLDDHNTVLLHQYIKWDTGDDENTNLDQQLSAYYEDDGARTEPEKSTQGDWVYDNKAMLLNQMGTWDESMG